MRMGQAPAKDIDAYIARFPRDVQARLKKVRTTIAKAVPGAEEGISYGIPVFKLHGNVVYFGGFAHHIGFFPGASPIREFKKELAGYPVAKGTVRFPNDEPIPFPLITKMTRFRAREFRDKAKAKAKARAKKK